MTPCPHNPPDVGVAWDEYLASRPGPPRPDTGGPLISHLGRPVDLDNIKPVQPVELSDEGRAAL